MPTIDDHDEGDDRDRRDRYDDRGERHGGDGSYDERADYDERDDDSDGADHDDLADFDAFLRVSAGLTGFDEAELRATGMAHEHHRTLLARRVRDEHALIHLWYVGAWPGEPPSSPRAHDQGLMWRTFRGAAPGAAAPGHGSWAEAPLGGGR
ncbi:hypothetical protein ACWDRR_25045 [Kitasatospora sp. NPDC003701]